MRSVAPEATRPPKSPGCSESVVTTSSPGPIPSPPIAMLHPSVVDVVSATHPFPAPMSPANASRSRSRSASACSKYGRLERPSSSSRRWTASIASTVARGSGPNVPAFR